MLMLKDLVENIREELEDVKKYAEASARVKLEDPALANVYADLGMEEMTHAEKLHRAAVELIDKATANGREAPQAMRAIWDFEHKIMIEEMARAKHLLEISRT
jgi:rubrerythrin